MLDEMTEAALEVLVERPRRLRADGRGRPHRQAVAPHGRRPGDRRDDRVRQRRGASARRFAEQARRHARPRARRPRVLGLQPDRRAGRRDRQPRGAARPTRRARPGDAAGAPEGRSAPTTRPASRATRSRPTATRRRFDVDGKILVGYGASGDRYETWLGKPLPVIDSLLLERHQDRAGAGTATSTQPVQARRGRGRLLPARPGGRAGPGGPHRRRHPGLGLQPRATPGGPSSACRPTPTSSSRSASWSSALADATTPRSSAGARAGSRLPGAEPPGRHHDVRTSRRPRGLLLRLLGLRRHRCMPAAPSSSPRTRCAAPARASRDVSSPSVTPAG